jgi:hypothetical protein
MNMASGHHEIKIHAGKFEPSGTLKGIAYLFTLIGAIGLVVGFLKNSDALWPAYLTALFFVSCLGIGGLFWTSLNNLCKVGWSVGIRRVAEGFTSFIPAMIIASLILAALGLKHLYPWARPEEVANDPVIAAKVGYLNASSMVVRLLVFGIGMFLFARAIVGNSVKQDANGDEALTHRNVGLSIAFVLFFAITFSLFSVDLLMSLLPSWYSTIFGIYCFAGLFQSSIAFLILVLLYLRKTGMIEGYCTDDHFHDLGKFLKGFTVFWAYIAFSQFMLIWYANIPEETEFFLMRSQNGWMMISMALLFFKFIVPFLALLPRASKRSSAVLVPVCVLILVMQYVDVWWMVGPNFNENLFHWGFYEATMLLGFLGILMLCMFRFYKKNGLVAVKDPRMREAITHHVTY